MPDTPKLVKLPINLDKVILKSLETTRKLPGPANYHTAHRKYSRQSQ